MTLAKKVLGCSEDYICFFNFARFTRRKKMTPSNQRKCRQNLLDCKSVLDRFGLKFWLMYGTLLGAIREGGFLKHDTDTDIGLFVDSKDDFSEVIQVLRKEQEFELIRTAYNDNLVTILRDDEYIDMGFYNPQCIPFSNFDLISFLGAEFFVPANYDEVLTELYGNWRVEDKTKKPNTLYNLENGL